MRAAPLSPLIVLLAALPAQRERPRPAEPGTRLRQLFERAVADLAGPAATDDATRRLTALGPSIVPLLREQLHHERAAHTTQQQRLQLLFVLGELGRAAVPAVPEVRYVLRGADEELGRRAVWTLTRLAPFLSTDAAEAVRQDLLRAPYGVRHDARAGVLEALLRLGSDPGIPALALHLEHRDCIAACHWVLAHANERPPDLDTLLPIVQRRLAAQMARADVAFDKGVRPAAADLAETALVLANGTLDAVTARALLGHRDPLQQQRALACMREHGASLAAAERADLAVQLWDPRPAGVVAVADVLASWGRPALLALLPLRLHGRTHSDADAARACGAAADAIVATCAGLPANDRALLARIDAIVRRQPPPPRAGAPSAGFLTEAATMLRLAQWDDGPVLEAVLAELGTPSSNDAAVGAVYGWLTTRDPAVANVALAWLAHDGAAVRRAIARRTPDGIADECARLARAFTPQGSRRAAIEAIAWFQTAGATEAELRAALDSPNTRLAVRALAALLHAGTHVPRETGERLAALVPEQLRLVLSHEAVTEAPAVRVTLGPCLHALAALALADQGIGPPATPEVTEAVAAHCGVAPNELPRWVREQRAAGTFAAVLDRIEAQCRTELGVDPALRWPALATAVAPR